MPLSIYADKFIGNVSLFHLFAFLNNLCGHVRSFASLAFLYLCKISHELVDVILKFVLDTESALILLYKKLLELEVVVDLRDAVPDLCQVFPLPLPVLLLLLLIFELLLRAYAFKGLVLGHGSDYAVLDDFGETSDVPLRQVLNRMIPGPLRAVTQGRLLTVLRHYLFKEVRVRWLGAAAVGWRFLTAW